MVPIDRKMLWNVAHEYTRRLAETFIARDRRHYTVSAAPASRAGRLFIDYLRNGRGTTAVGAWSRRARPGYPIAVPISWAEVRRGIRPDAYTIGPPPRLMRLRTPGRNRTYDAGCFSLVPESTTHWPKLDALRTCRWAARADGRAEALILGSACRCKAPARTLSGAKATGDRPGRLHIVSRWRSA